MCLGLTLFTAIVLSQPQYYDKLVNQPLGRAILLGILGWISIHHPMYGVILLSLVAIFYYENQNHFGILLQEGFVSSGGQPLTTSGPFPVLSSSTQHSQKQQPGKEKGKGKGKEKGSGRGVEGFNLLDREDTLKRGKVSNSIPVSDSHKKMPEHVEPYDLNALKGLPSMPY